MPFSPSCKSARVFALAVLLGAVACNKSEPAPPTPAQAPVEQKVASAPTPAIEDATFKLALAKEAEITAGAPASLKLLLEARGGYHVNQDYPI